MLIDLFWALVTIAFWFSTPMLVGIAAMILRAMLCNCKD